MFFSIVSNNVCLSVDNHLEGRRERGRHKDNHTTPRSDDNVSAHQSKLASQRMVRIRIIRRVSRSGNALASRLSLQDIRRNSRSGGEGRVGRVAQSRSVSSSTAGRNPPDPRTDVSSQSQVSSLQCRSRYFHLWWLSLNILCRSSCLVNDTLVFPLLSFCLVFSSPFLLSLLI